MTSRRLALREECRASFPAFLALAFAVLNPGQVLKPAGYLDALCFELERITSGGSQSLVVNLPPRHLKSITISVAWVAWWLGRNPALRFLCASFSEKLAEDLARNCRLLMESQAYKNIFPKTILARRDTLDLVTTANGGRIGTSIFGSITGRGADIIILDDPINANDAQSQVMRDKVEDIYRNTLTSRSNNPNEGIFVVVQQRLHEDDLTGRLLKNPAWRSLVLPAIADKAEVLPIGGGRFYRRQSGDLLDPERMDAKALEKMRAAMGLENFSAQFLQAPLPDQGRMFRKEWICIEPMIEREAGDIVIQSWDTAVKTGAEHDFSAGICAILRKGRLHLRWAGHDKLEFPRLCELIEESAHADAADIILVEDASSGVQVAQHFAVEPLSNNRLITSVKYPGSKQERAARASIYLRQGRVIVPANLVGGDDLMRELLSFPSGTNDDLVDALVQMILFAAEHDLSTPQPLESLRMSPWVFGVDYENDLDEDIEEELGELD